MTLKETIAEYRKARNDYRFDSSIFSEDEPRVARVKEIIERELSQADRTIILLYAECGSYRKLGQMLGLSHMTARSECMRIRKEILKKYGE
jgi:DNA-directed RNA polymerase specialized sigma24 family protein